MYPAFLLPPSGHKMHWLNQLFMKNGIICFLLITGVAALSSGCGKKEDDDPAEKIYRVEGSINIDGRERTYLLNLPPGYYEGSGFSLVIAMHGGGGSATQFETSSLLTQKANAENFIVVYPEGVKSTGPLGARTWNAGTCCAYAVENNINDVKFITTLIDKLVADYKINAKKVYATGHSNGGMMSYRLACEASNKIAAIAPNGCTMVVTQPCNPARAVPVLHMHSVLDEHIPYTGGTGNGISGVYAPPLDSVFNVWSSKNTCTTTAQVVINNSSYKFTRWTNCSNNTAIHYYLTQDGGHAWPGGLPGSGNGDTPSQAINANNLLWDFFKQYQLP
jgi:polyhydroxybutyrate depolymerase